MRHIFLPVLLVSTKRSGYKYFFFFSQLFIGHLLLVWWDACKIMIFGYKTSFKECYIRPTNRVVREFLLPWLFVNESFIICHKIWAKFIEYLSEWTKFYSIFNTVWCCVTQFFPLLHVVNKAKRPFYMKNVTYLIFHAG